MFIQHQNRNLLQAAFSTLMLIYHQAVYNLRKTERSAITGLLMVFVRSIMLVGMFLAMYLVIGVRSSPLRGDFTLFIFSGIFIYLTHVAAVGAVAGSGAVNAQMHLHGPINSAVLIGGAALAVLYQQVLSVVVLLWIYDAAFVPVRIEDWQACMAMLILAWFWGCCVGLIFLGISPWWPKASTIATTIYQRLNMIASGKMFVANAIPAMMLPYVSWNPLFHIIDQTRGFTFINYNPHNSNLAYPMWCCVAFMVIGLMLEFFTRNRVSVSWSAGR